MQPTSTRRLLAAAAPATIAAALIAACGGDTTATQADTPAIDPCSTPAITAANNAANTGSLVELQISYTGSCSSVDVTNVTFPVPVFPDVVLDLASVDLNSNGNTHSLSIPANEEYCGYISWLGGEMIGGEANGTVTISGQEHNFSATLNATCPFRSRG